MKKSEILEVGILLVPGVLLFLIWVVSSQPIQLPSQLLKVLKFVEYPIIVVPVVILLGIILLFLDSRENKI